MTHSPTSLTRRQHYQRAPGRPKVQMRASAQSTGSATRLAGLPKPISLEDTNNRALSATSGRNQWQGLTSSRTRRGSSSQDPGTWICSRDCHSQAPYAICSLEKRQQPLRGQSQPSLMVSEAMQPLPLGLQKALPAASELWKLDPSALLLGTAAGGETNSHLADCFQDCQASRPGCRSRLEKKGTESSTSRPRVPKTTSPRPDPRSATGRRLRCEKHI